MMISYAPFEFELSVLAGQLACALVGLGAGVAEEDAVQRRVVDDGLCEIELWGGVEEVAHLEDEARLLSNRLGDRGVRVAEIEHRPSGREVEVRLAVVIEHPAALTSDQNRRHAAHDLHVVLGFLGFVFGGSGHLSGPDESAAVRSAHGVFNN